MILLNDFFRIKSINHDEKGGMICEISLNPSHIIFQSHFPGDPITPGVCQIGIVEEIISLQLKKDVRVSKVSNIKYINILRPGENEIVDVYISPLKEVEDGYAVQCSLSNKDCIYTKMSLRLQ